jgi:hypothetical protein
LTTDYEPLFSYNVIMFGSKHDHWSLVCYVGSATVSASVVRFSKKAKPTILASVLLPMSIASDSKTGNIETKVLGLMEQALVTLVSQEIPKLGSSVVKQKNIGYAQVILSSPWYISKSAWVNISKDKSFILNDSILHETLSEQEKIFEKETLEGNYQSMVGEDIHMIEREVLSVSLNGYNTRNPYNKRTRYADLSLYMSLAPQKFLTKISEVVKKHFHINKIKFHTTSLVFFRTASSLFPHESEALLIEVDGETSQVTLVSGDSIVSSTNFGYGRNNTLREMMNKLSVTQEIAISSLRLMESGTLADEAKISLQNALAEDANNWNNRLTGVLSEIKSHKPLPSVCFLLCNEDVSTVFMERLKEIGSKFDISHIIAVNAKVLNSHVAVGKFVVTNDFILLHSLYFMLNDVYTGW